MTYNCRRGGKLFFFVRLCDYVFRKKKRWKIGVKKLSGSKASNILDYKLLRQISRNANYASIK